jgi:glucosamine--fructose-6-phosphate aminotransferase (isomerizing)
MQKGQKTLDEISRQPFIFDAVWNDRDDIASIFIGILEEYAPDEIIITGCGTSYYLSQAAAPVLAHFLRMPVKAVPSSELFLFTNTYLHGQKVLLIAVSRSGQTTETVKAVRVLKEQPNVFALAVSCYADSDLCHAADRYIISSEAKEQSVVMTGSFSSMLYILMLAAFSAAKENALLKEASRLASEAERLLPDMNDLAQTIMSSRSLSHFVYLGSGPNYGLSQEAMLKVKEMAIVTSEGYHAMEFRHGPKSIVNPNMLISMFMSDDAIEYEVNLLEEIKGLGGVTLAICDGTGERVRPAADYVMDIACGMSQWVRLPIYIIQAQLLAFYLATSVKGIDPDSPQNLSQVVTL